MRREQATGEAKGWLVGPWDSDVPISVGFATVAVDEPHAHATLTEIYIVARGSSSVRVETATVELGAGDVLILTPGEAHTFLASSDDYLHFVVHAPQLPGDEARGEKQAVPRSRLGL